MIGTLDRYILRQVLTPLFATMSVGLLVLLAERMVRLLDTTLGKRNSFAIVFEMLAYLVPHYLGLAVPAALFLGMLLGFNKISKDGEIDAWMASGVGLSRLARPAMMLGLVLSILSLAVFGWLQPHTRYAYRSVLFDVRNVDVFYLAEEGVFMQAGTRTFIIDTLDRNNNAFDRIFVFDDKGAKGIETVTATRGFWLNKGEKNSAPCCGWRTAGWLDIPAVARRRRKEPGAAGYRVFHHDRYATRARLRQDIQAARRGRARTDAAGTDTKVSTPRPRTPQQRQMRAELHKRHHKH